MRSFKPLRVFKDKKFLKFKTSKETKRTSVAAVANVNTTTVSGEVIPWGTSAVWQGEDITQRGNFASDTYAFVIDSGVLDTTGDISFASDPSWHRSWIAGQSPFTDVNGHGTHVAGTIGALVNGKGIVGVAPGAKIVSLKVNDDSGFGSGSTTIAAINHAVSIINGNNLDKSKVVINLSINATYDPALNAAIINAANQGIRFSISAGNNGKDVDGFSPGSAGSHPNVYTVSAVDSNFMMTFWSNWDRLDATDAIDNVDLAAPGSSILSYYKNGQLATLSGTSMASAHVAGLLITGGVQAGHTVIPNYGGTADPFALSSTKVFDPSVNKPIPPAPAPAPAPVATPAPAPAPVPNPPAPVAPPAPVITNKSYWGTLGNDIITGSDTPNQVDWLSGALSTGTTLAEMGRGQIDTLIGNVGADIFLLSDKRGLFYGDRQALKSSIVDHAIIKNFTPGEDKLQLKGVQWVWNYSDGNTFVYWDRNRNGILDFSPSVDDQLIAIVEGVNRLSASDFVYPI
jgi:subtilisin family serine protease